MLQSASIRIPANALGFFSQALCNTTDINATHSSNHTLSIFSNQRPSDLDQYLEWNTNANKKVVAHQKVFLQHFICDFHMKPFIKMHPDVLGHVLSFMDKASTENVEEKMTMLVVQYYLNSSKAAQWYVSE